MSELTESERAEAAALIRDFHEKKLTAFTIAMNAIDGQPRKELGEKIILAAEIFGEATSRLEDWMKEREHHQSLCCDGRFYLIEDGELIVIDPTNAIDVTGAQ